MSKLTEIVNNIISVINNTVRKTGDQTIAGVKTFSSSPIVPTPTNDMQVSTKKYVDDLGALKAPLSSPALTGTPTAPTPASSDNSTKIATTAWNKLGFASSFTTNGYIKFPSWLGGFTFQWIALSAGNGTGPFTVTLPLAFPNNNLAALIAGNGNSVATDSWATANKTLTRIEAYKVNPNPRTATIFLIGN